MRSTWLQVFSSCQIIVRWKTGDRQFKWDDATWREPSEKEIARAKELVKQKEEKHLLEQTVQRAVRKHLMLTFPAGFLPSPQIWKATGRGEPKALSNKVQTLLTLNGFQPVPLPTAVDSLGLAEGCLAYPNFYSRIGMSDVPYLLFAKPQDEDDDAIKKLPPIVQDDIQLYRVLENQAGLFLMRRVKWWQGFVQRRIEQPIARGMERVQGILSGQPPVEKKKVGTVTVRSGWATVDDDDEEKAEPVENLLVFGPDEVVLYKGINESTRLVTLPYSLGHKGASTLISWSLVVFGALPLAYRSLNFAFLYPGLSEALAFSVVFTILYGIWQQRYNARTSQSYAVSNALLHRVLARDDAAVWVLQEEAIRQTTQGILAEYVGRLEMEENTLAFLDIPERSGINTLASLSLNEPGTVEPLELAVKFGLLKPSNDSENAILEPTVPLKDAPFVVEESLVPHVLLEDEPCDE
eukprot:Nitzschia sp. Nitz4//scaffold43_size134323//38993//40468//NITZ4_003290-RA/size134323-snap-gene-0.43-mRNA-1//1//CDS//3329551921//5779//frame0